MVRISESSNYRGFELTDIDCRIKINANKQEVIVHRLGESHDEKVENTENKLTCLSMKITNAN